MTPKSTDNRGQRDNGAHPETASLGRRGGEGAGRRASPALSARRRRLRRAKRTRRIAAVTTIAVLAMALLAMIAWLLFLRRPELVIQNYPMEYEAQIRARAAENGIPPAYAAAVVLAESSYRADAVSSANAQGLMQLLPSTAEWIAGKFDESYVEGCLFDPDINIKYGCWYLGFLLGRYGGDMRCATAAYHAGQGTVDQWLQNPEYSADGATLDVIASGATDTYVKRVLKYYEKYEQMYAQADQRAGAGAAAVGAARPGRRPGV